jgi:prepilin-type N-terminal cleavage/methylation domain-containing protein
MTKRLYIESGIFAAGRRGFSLIEVIIVAAILSILSAIAFINSQRVMDDARRKSVIAETGEIAKAMTFARQDTGFFPKLNYLLEPLVTPVGGSGEGIVQYPPATPPLLYPDFDYVGRTITPVYGRRIHDSWVGRYFALSATGRSGQRAPSSFTWMTLPQRKDALREWPVDQWGFPYVVYLLESTPADDKVDGPVRFLTVPTAAPSYAAAVVSYGEDNLPGSLANKNALKTDPEYLRKVAQRLFREISPLKYSICDSVAGSLDFDGAPGRQRVEGYSEVRFQNAPGYTWAGTKNLIGVIDPGSDDVIYEF